jgi:beta-lactam-binding protein with PASTA domain
MRFPVKWYEILLASIIYFFLIVATFFVFDRWIMPKVARRGEVVEVPDIRGKMPEEASKILREAGLESTVVGTIYSEISVGKVAELEPRPGKVVKRGRTVKLFVSKGLGEEDTLSQPLNKRPPIP